MLCLSSKGTRDLSTFLPALVILLVENTETSSDLHFLLKRLLVNNFLYIQEQYQRFFLHD